MLPQNPRGGPGGPRRPSANLFGTPGEIPVSVMAANRRLAEEKAREDADLQESILRSLGTLPAGGLLHDEMYNMVARFAGETFVAVDTAWQYLIEAEWKFERALEAFYNAEPEGSDLTDVADLESEEEAEEVKEKRRVTDNKQTQQAAVGAENADVDREPAERDCPDPSKLTISIMRDGIRHTYTHSQRVDWENPKSISALNRWRSQIFRNGGFPPIRETAIPYLPAESDFITELIRQAKRAHDQRGGGTSFRPRWAQITQEFNRRFAGKVAEGSEGKRKARSANSVRDQGGRLPAAAEIMGRNVRKNPVYKGTRKGEGKIKRNEKGKRKGKGKRKDEDEDEDGDEDDDEDRDEDEDEDEDEEENQDEDRK